MPDPKYRRDFKFRRKRAEKYRSANGCKILRPSNAATFLRIYRRILKRERLSPTRNIEHRSAFKKMISSVEHFKNVSIRLWLRPIDRGYTKISSALRTNDSIRKLSEIPCYSGDRLIRRRERDRWRRNKEVVIKNDKDPLSTRRNCFQRYNLSVSLSVSPSLWRQR